MEIKARRTANTTKRAFREAFFPKLYGIARHTDWANGRARSPLRAEVRRPPIRLRSGQAVEALPILANGRLGVSCRGRARRLPCESGSAA